MGQQPSSSWNEGNRHILATGQWAYLPAQCRCQLQPALWTTNRHILSQLPKPQSAISGRNNAWRRAYSIHKQQAGNRQMAFHRRSIPHLMHRGKPILATYSTYPSVPAHSFLAIGQLWAAFTMPLPIWRYGEILISSLTLHTRPTWCGQSKVAIHWWHLQSSNPTILCSCLIRLPTTWQSLWRRPISTIIIL